MNIINPDVSNVFFGVLHLKDSIVDFNALPIDHKGLKPSLAPQVLVPLDLSLEETVFEALNQIRTEAQRQKADYVFISPIILDGVPYSFEVNGRNMQVVDILYMRKPDSA